MAGYTVPESDSLILSKAVADRLIAGRDGVLALAYLCALKHPDGCGQELMASELGVSGQEAERLLQKLAGMGLLSPAETEKAFSPEDVTAAMGKKDFSFLAGQAEHLFGEKLAVQDLQRLLYIREGLGLPTEVVLQMMQYFKNDVRRRYGPGRRLSAAKLEKMAADWKQRGIDTLEKAEAYIRRKEGLAAREGEFKRALGIYDRKLTETERGYIESWIDMGFDGAAAHLCYERTLDQIHTLNFKYMDRIFLNWHGKGLHTTEQIEKGDGARRGRTAPRTEPEAGARNGMPAPDETDRLIRLTESMREEDI